MEIRINKRFLKELASLPVKDRQRIEKFVFEDSSGFKKITDIPGLHKLKGYANFYRIRFGDYRAGLKHENNIITFERLLHRKEIYKYYP